MKLFPIHPSCHRRLRFTVPFLFFIVSLQHQWSSFIVFGHRKYLRLQLHTTHWHVYRFHLFPLATSSFSHGSLWLPPLPCTSLDPDTSCVVISCTFLPPIDGTRPALHFSTFWLSLMACTTIHCWWATRPHAHAHRSVVTLVECTFACRLGHMVVMCQTPTLLCDVSGKLARCAHQIFICSKVTRTRDTQMSCENANRKEKKEVCEKVNTAWPKFTLNYEIVERTALRNENHELLQWNLWVLCDNIARALPLHDCVGCHAEEQCKSEFDISMSLSQPAKSQWKTWKNFLNKHILFKYPMPLDDNGCCDCSPSFFFTMAALTLTHSPQPFNLPTGDDLLTILLLSHNFRFSEFLAFFVRRFRFEPNEKLFKNRTESESISFTVEHNDVEIKKVNAIFHDVGFASIAPNSSLRPHNVETLARDPSVRCSSWRKRIPPRLDFSTATLEMVAAAAKEKCN